MSALAALHAALFQRLKGSAALAALVSARIHEDGAVPAGTPKPYVTVGGGATETERGGSLGQRGLGEIVSAHVFSDYEGQSEALGIAAVVDSEARASPLIVAGHTPVRLRLEFMAPLVEEGPGKQTRHVPLRWRAQTWEA